MSNDRINEKYKDLLADGPMTTDTLGGHPSVDARRIYDIRKFNPKDQTTGIWHLDDHAPEHVLRAWLATNQDALSANNLTRRSLSNTLSGFYADVWRVIQDEDRYDWLAADRERAGGANETPPKTCLKCGEDDIKNLPHHMRGCDGTGDGEAEADADSDPA